MLADMGRTSVQCARVVGTGHVSAQWETICQHHQDDLPGIRELHKGSLNLRLIGGKSYVPPGDAAAKALARLRGQSGGNHISTRAKIIELNGHPVEMWIYRGGHPDTDLELLSRTLPLSEMGVTANSSVTAIIEEN